MTDEALPPPPERPAPSEPAAAPPPPPPPPPPRPRVARAGYTTALTRSLLALVIVLLLGEVVAFLAVFDSDLASSDVVKIGGMTFFSFHHVGISTSVVDLDIGGLLGAVPGGGEGLAEGLAGGIDATITFSIAALVFTLLAAWLLYRGGRAAAEAGGGTTAGRLMVGALVGVPYAVLAFALSFLLRFRFDAGPVGEITVGVAPIGALLWPLAFGLVFGGLGGLFTAREDWSATESGRRWLAVLAGGGRMLRWGLVLSAAGLLVLAAASPDVTREYFSAVAEAGAFDGFRLVFFTAVLGAPLLAVNGLLGGMFVPIVVGEYLAVGCPSIGDTLSQTCTSLVSLLDFPRGGPGLDALDPLAGATGGQPPSLPIDTGLARPEYFVFVVVALVAVILGGRYAARRGGAGTRGRGAALGAGAGAVWALGSVFLAVLGSVGISAEVRVAFFHQSVLGHLGPHLPFAFLLALVWGGLGGALGGAMGGGRGASREVIAESEGPGIAPGPSGEDSV